MISNGAYLVDFDGTITTIDISQEMATCFGGTEYAKIEQMYRNRQIPIRKWLRLAAEKLPPDPKRLLEKAMEWAEIRPGFEEFLNFAGSEGRSVVVASDGFGFYIEPILRYYGLYEKVDLVFKNNTFLNSKGSLEVNTPYAHKVCTVCGNCKSSHVIRLKEEEKMVIYIGDGSNDRFGASWADHVCARDQLLAYCHKYNFSYSQWDNFYDIINIEFPQSCDRAQESLCNPRGNGVRIIS
ncbi:MAG: MtnX-like HAD-IB family phosphatase [Bacillota bacterium]